MLNKTSSTFIKHTGFVFIVGYEKRERKLAYSPPDPDVLKNARELRIKEMRMYDIIREILFYSIFLWVLMVVGYGFRDPNAFHLKNNIQNTLTDLGLGEFGKPSNSFVKVNMFTTVLEQ